MLSILKQDRFPAFNLGRQFNSSLIPSHLCHKIIDADGHFVLYYASRGMLDKFADHPTCVALDGTHGTNTSKYILMSLLVLGELAHSLIMQCAAVEGSYHWTRNQEVTDLEGRD